MISCEGCLKYKKHQQKKEEARQGYKSDKSVSEGKSNNDTIFFSLDLQKVRMLPEIPGVKSAVFTGRICAYNESFSPIGRQKGKSYAIIWHQGISGRNDEDIASAFRKFICRSENRDIKHIVLWMDNCGAQNKNWTLFSTLAAVVNGPVESNLESITLKYFEVGHTYMSADSFHHMVESEAKKLGRLYDFNDFVQCVKQVGIAIQMKLTDFRQWENQFSKGKASKENRPLLDSVNVAQFRKGSPCLFFKKSHTEDVFSYADFLKKTFKHTIVNQESPFLPPQSSYNGIDQSRKDGIIRALVPLMPENRRSFWEQL